MATRGKMKQFRVTDAENECIVAGARDAGFAKVSDYLRAISLHSTVVVVAASEVRVIPSTITTADVDAELLRRLEAVLAGLEGEAPNPPAAAAPAGTPALAGTPPADSGSAPTASAGEGQTVGASGSQAPTPVPAPAAEPTAAPQGTSCPDCGAPAGSHHGFCEQVRGEPPVPPAGTQEPAASATGSVAEDREAFMARRVSEQEAEGAGTAVATHVAEAEWRAAQSAPAAPPVQAPTPAEEARVPQAPCSRCGAMKLPTQSCRDCGARPDVI